MKLSEVLALREKAKKKESTPSVAPGGSAKKSGIRVIRTRLTPNPSALQYVLNAQILDYGNRNYSSRKECEGDRMAQALFDLRNVKNVFVMENFVTVTKDDATDWDPLRDQVWKTIDNHAAVYPAGGKTAHADIDVENFMSLPREKKLEAVEMVLNRSIRSNLARDGGGVELKGMENNVVQLRYQGACGSCPTSTTGTLQYIQGQLKQQLHPDLEVESV